jgi:hypothetical protein
MSNLNSPLHHSLISIPLSTIQTVPTGIIFPLTYMHIQYLHYIRPPTLFPYILPLPLVPTPLDRTFSALLFFNFVKDKKWHFCLFKVGIQGVSLWHVYMYYHFFIVKFVSFIILFRKLIHYFLILSFLHLLTCVYIA